MSLIYFNPDNIGTWNYAAELEMKEYNRIIFSAIFTAFLDSSGLYTQSSAPSAP